MHTKLVLLCCLTEYLHGTSEESVSVLHADERNDIGIRAVPVRSYAVVSLAAAWYGEDFHH